jgi:hypothetical protein
MINFLRQMHEGVVPNTHERGLAQIDFPLITSGLDEHIIDVVFLDRYVLQSDQSGMFVVLGIEVFFGQHPAKLAGNKFCNLKLDDPIISDKYRKILHI